MSGTHRRVRAAPLTVRHLARTMPWVVLLAGCTGSVGAAVLIDATSRTPLDASQIRLTLLPCIAALCFVPHVHFRPVTQTVPVPSWLAVAGHTLLAVPLLAATCAANLTIMAAGYVAPTQAPALYPLAAQFAGWAGVAVLIAAWCDRTRLASLNGAVAAPVTIALITVAWAVPQLRRVLSTPGAQPHTATVAWYAIAAAAFVGAWIASRDRFRWRSRRAAGIARSWLRTRSSR